MRDLETYAVTCMEMLDDLSIPYGKILEVTPNTRAGSRWGQCRKTPAGYSININADLLREANDERGLMNTLLHELLHTCPGCMNHGKIWKGYAEQVRLAYGYDVKRCSSAEEKGVTEKTVGRKEDYKYFCRCEKCGYVFKYKRMCKTVENPGRYIHTDCGGRLALA